jgi:hypothetical protein
MNYPSFVTAATTAESKVLLKGRWTMKYADLKAIFAEEQTNRGLLVIGLEPQGRQVEVLFQITTEPKANWEAVSVRYL